MNTKIDIGLQQLCVEILKSNQISASQNIIQRVRGKYLIDTNDNTKLMSLIRAQIRRPLDDMLVPSEDGSNRYLRTEEKEEIAGSQLLKFFIRVESFLATGVEPELGDSLTFSGVFKIHGHESSHINGVRCLAYMLIKVGIDVQLEESGKIVVDPSANGEIQVALANCPPHSSRTQHPIQIKGKTMTNVEEKITLEDECFAWLLHLKDAKMLAVKAPTRKGGAYTVTVKDEALTAFEPNDLARILIGHASLDTTLGRELGIEFSAGAEVTTTTGKVNLNGEGQEPTGVVNSLFQRAGVQASTTRGSHIMVIPNQGQIEDLLAGHKDPVPFIAKR